MFNVKLIMCLIERVNNIVGKGENAGYQRYLLSYNIFKRLLSQGRSKSESCGKELTNSMSRALAKGG